MLASTQFDDFLGYMLSPALANYELERTCGLTYGNDEFSSGIAKIVPDGHIFKAFSMQVQGMDTAKIFAGIMQNKTGREILDTKGDTIRFAVRTKVVIYPEDIAAVWTLLAVRYRSLI